MDDEGVTGGELTAVVAGTGTLNVTVGSGSTPGLAVEPAASTAATGAGSIAVRMPNQDRPMATVVTNAQATRYPTDRLTATTLL
ncbi:hypothetical protein GCM10010178_36470 [Lentzea flava]|uniref:Uncharacterized protein n=1 Tax=Lentzea flava TaxID=103732 RepID=A0ABQ2UJU9_9PSEU|nr:hypothetical protein [Lentzea flava]GGU40710.1 hypothetical protein GCM10010178_36470 [Lentzea flava]